MKTTKILMIFFLFSIVFFACNKDEEKEKNKSIITGHSDCKESSDFSRAGAADDQSCIEYQYDAEMEKLSLFHVNAAFNCCPGTIISNYELKGNEILLTEAETNGMCSCLCLFDLEMVIRKLPPGIYQLKLTEPYLENQEALEFELDLQESSSGSHCVDRTEYPWGVYSKE